MISGMTLPANLDQLSADELRELVRRQAEVITRNDRELNWRKVKIDKLTHEVAYYKRHYFGIKAERLPVEQGQLFEETLAADMAAITEELAQLSETKPKGQAKRKPLPPELPRTEIHHEPESTTCACGCQMKRIGEDIAETRLHARHFYGRASHPWKMGLRPLRNPGADNGTGPCGRKGHSDHRPARPSADRQVSRSRATVSPGRHLW